MPYSRVVEERYRLQPADLTGSTLVEITNVTLQGLEQTHPVLHFDHFQKRLVLNDEQSDELARVTQSALFTDWVGRKVRLDVISEAAESRIAISSPDIRPPQPIRPRKIPDQTINTRSFIPTVHLPIQALLLSLLIILLAILLVAAIYALFNTELLWRYWDDFSFPGRSP